MTLERYSWTQPCCVACYDEHHRPGSTAGRTFSDLNLGESCCHCGALTRAGIFVRVDPETVKHPTAVRD